MTTYDLKKALDYLSPDEHKKISYLLTADPIEAIRKLDNVLKTIENIDRKAFKALARRALIRSVK